MLTKTIVREYRRRRRNGWLATNALRAAKVQSAFDALEDETVRLRIVPDDYVGLDDLFGDTYNPDANPDIPIKQMEREKQEEIDRINRDGVWGVIGEYFDGCNWQHADSCFGFVGDDWRDSGYDIDIMESALDALAELEHCPTCGHVVETGS